MEKQISIRIPSCFDTFEQYMLHEAKELCALSKSGDLVGYAKRLWILMGISAPLGKEIYFTYGRVSYEGIEHGAIPCLGIRADGGQMRPLVVFSADPADGGGYSFTPVCNTVKSLGTVRVKKEALAEYCKSIIEAFVSYCRPSVDYLKKRQRQKKKQLRRLQRHKKSQPAGRA